LSISIYQLRASSDRFGDALWSPGMSASPDTRKNEPRIAIIGAGPGGLCMAARLEQAGFHDIVILEQAGGVGGTWYHNRYPGCACDIPSYLYSFSFEPKRDWTRPFAPQPEIQRYLEDFADKYDLLRLCHFDDGVERATWHEADATWCIETASGKRYEAEILVGAVGMFNELVEPQIAGLDTFTGTRFHSARWNWEHDLSADRVAVIGSAASAVQFVPEIVKQAQQVHLFQRTANWVLPKEDTPFTPEEIAAFANTPGMAEAARQEIFDNIDPHITFHDPARVAESESHGLANIEVVEDPEVREKLRPQHPFGCKRPLMSNEYYPAFNRPNLELVTESIDHIEADAVVTVDGKRREVDTLILATGFATTRYLSAIEVVGRRGQTLDQAWNDGATAYLGVTTAGFPNLFMLYGPNTNNGSIITMIESQVEYTLRQVERIASQGLSWIDVRPEVMERFNEAVQRDIAGVRVWNAGCVGYYRSPSGRVVTQWPHTMTEYERRTSAPDEDAYEVLPR